MIEIRLASPILAIAALLGVVCNLSAQTSRGTVTGIVTDRTKSSVPGATVEIDNTQTGVVRTTTTNSAGVYRFDAVDLGPYDVTVKASGFRSYTERGIVVQAAQIASVDATLEVGDTATAIEVTASSAQLQTESAVRGGNLNPAQINHVPVFSRNPNMLAVILPGVTEQRADLPGTATFSVNGARGRSNNFLLDGTENNDISTAGQAFQIKNPEVVQEVSVQTGLFDAEFGRAGGGVVNTITKSGTNAFHGTLGWVAEFTNFDATTNTLSLSDDVKRRGKLPPGYEQFYNGTIGGPVIKDRTFFYTSWQEQRRRAPANGALVTLTPLGRDQLRSIFPSGVNPRADLYLDITKNVAATGQPFAVDLGDGRGNAQFGTAVVSYPSRFDGRQSLSKVDHHFSDRDLLSFRYAYDRSVNPTFNVSFPGFSTSEQQHYQNSLLTETHIFSPALTNELRLPFNRIAFEYPNDATDPRAATLPIYTFTGITSIGVSPSFPQGRVANNFGLQDTLNWVRGKHSFRFGFDLLDQRARQAGTAIQRGEIDYRDSNVAGVRYSAFANFLDDYAGAGALGRDFGSAVYYPSLFRQAYFAQDRWQVKENLTVTLGLRWEDFGTPVNSLRTPAYAGLFNVKVDPATRNFTAPMAEANQTTRDLNNFAPVVGLTYSPRFENGPLAWFFGNGRSVIRTGYNIGYDSFFNNIASNAAASSPNLVSTLVLSAPDAANVRGLAHASQALPATPRRVLPSDNQTLVIKDLRNPYYQRWSFGIQRELPWGLLADAAYVGSSGTRLFINEDLNPQVVNLNLLTLPAGFTSIQQLQDALPSVYRLQSRIDPLQGGRNIRTNGGHSSYHSGQFQLTKRFTRDLGFSAAYTWSKLLDNGSELFLFNNSNPNAAVPSVFGGQHLEKAVSLYDRPYRLVLTYNYELPWLRAQRGVAGRILGGWQVAGLTTFESGVPLNVTNGADADGLGGTGDRPDVNPAGAAGVRARPDATSPTGYVNPDVLGANGRPVAIDPKEARYIGLPANAGRTGNAGRNLERTPGIRNTNANIFKNIRLTERFLLEFRTEFYNVFNHPQYGYPSVSPFTSLITTPASNVTGSGQGKFLNYSQLDGGGRTIRYALTLRF